MRVKNFSVGALSKVGALTLFVSSSAFAEFVKQENPNFSGKFQVPVSELCQVAKNTLSYIKKYPQDKFAVHRGSVLPKEITLAKVKATLEAVCSLPKQELSPTELMKDFDFYMWQPDISQAIEWANKSDSEVKKRLLTSIPKEHIFLTKYYVKQLNASAEKTDNFAHALYQIPFDEQKLSAEQAELEKDTLTRYQYTRQQVMAGVLDSKQLAKPLVWLSEEALHDVLLQGTGVAKVGSEYRYFNVHRNNGIAYDYTLGKREQARYWYFAQVAGILGYGTEIENKIPLRAQVSLAGNVKELGLGKLFLIEYKNNSDNEIAMAVLADQGGAFDNNLFQLDWLKGSYYGWKDYYQANKSIADYARVWLLIKK